MRDLITIGDCTIDAFNFLDEDHTTLVCDKKTGHCQLCLRYADKIPVGSITRLVAGNAANNAVGASRLGLDVAIYTVVGADPEGEKIRQVLEHEGVRTDYMLAERGTETNFHTVLVYKNERTILIHHVPRAYHLPRFEKSAWIYLTSMAKGGHTIFTDLAHYIRGHNAKLMFQPGTFQLQLGVAKCREILQLTEIIIMNKEEAELFLGYNQADNVSVPRLLKSMLALGPKIVVITDGLKGSSAATYSEAWTLGTRPEVKRIESTGAGDAYASGFLAARSLNRSIPEAMRWGTHNAESVVGAVGPQVGLLTRETIESTLQRYSNFVPDKLPM